MRVAVSPDTHEAAGEPELISVGRAADDFLLDLDADVAYLAAHRENTIDRLVLDPASVRNFYRDSVSSHPLEDFLVGPTSGAWGRGAGEKGRVAYFLTDGGTKSPPKEGPQTAKLLRVEFHA